jgi:hypothetical protein
MLGKTGWSQPQGAWLFVFFGRHQRDVIRVFFWDVIRMKGKRSLKTRCRLLSKFRAACTSPMMMMFIGTENLVTQLVNDQTQELQRCSERRSRFLLKNEELATQDGMRQRTRIVRIAQDHGFAISRHLIKSKRRQARRQQTCQVVVRRQQ